MKRHKNFEGLVESIIYKPPPDSAAALEWGRSHEDIARQTYITTKKEQFGQLYQVKKTGIHISVENPWLAASPDGLIEDPSENDERRYGILEIKCPYSARKMTPEDACHEINHFYCTSINGHTLLKQTHNYYYQIQGQLAITQLPWCDFVVWTPHGTSVERIEWDITLWQQKVFPKLKIFYHEYLLPELADPVFYRGNPIRHLAE